MTFCWITSQPVLQQQFKSSVKTALNALNMSNNGGGLRLSEKCKLPGYKFWVWFSKKPIINIICLKNGIKIYRVTYESELDTTFVVHCTQFGLPDVIFEMHPCGLHGCHPKKMGVFGFIQTVKDNMSCSASGKSPVQPVQWINMRR